MTRVALYARISDDPTDTRLGVDRQVADCLAVAERKGWVVAEQYIDNDVSAYRKGVVRPRFEDMLRDLSSGARDGAVVYDLDRLARQPRDLERMIDLFEGKPLVFASAEGDIDLQSSSGRTLARVMTAFANKSSADTGRRVSRKHLELAQAGKPVGTRVFGWANHTDLHPVEAPIAREGIDMLLSGSSIRAICREWNEVGVKTVRGNEWGGAALRYYLRNPRLAGMRTRHGEIVLSEARKPVLGTWEPLIDVETWERVQTLVRKPDRRSRVPRRGSRRYLLTGLLLCGVCGDRMYGNDRGDMGHVYRCNKSSHNSITGKYVDEFISDLILMALQDINLDTQPKQWPGEERFAEIGEKISELMESYTSGSLNGSIALPAVQRLEDERQEMQKGRARWMDSIGSASTAVTPREWESYDAAGKRTVIDSMLEGVIIRKPTRRSSVVDLSRIEPLWLQ